MRIVFYHGKAEIRKGLQRNYFETWAAPHKKYSLKNGAHFFGPPTPRIVHASPLGPCWCSRLVPCLRRVFWITCKHGRSTGLFRWSLDWASRMQKLQKEGMSFLGGQIRRQKSAKTCAASTRTVQQAIQLQRASKSWAQGKREIKISRRIS